MYGLPRLTGLKIATPACALVRNDEEVVCALVRNDEEVVCALVRNDEEVVCGTGSQ